MSKNKNTGTNDKEKAKIDTITALLRVCYDYDIQSLVIATFKINRIQPKNCEIALASFQTTQEQRKILLDFVREMIVREVNDPSIYIDTRILEDKKNFWNFIEEYADHILQKEYQYFFAYLYNGRNIFRLCDSFMGSKSEKKFIQKYRKETVDAFEKIKKYRKKTDQRILYASRNSISRFNILYDILSFFSKEENFLVFLFSYAEDFSSVDVVILPHSSDFPKNFPQEMYMRLCEEYTKKYEKLFPENSLVIKANIPQRSVLISEILHCTLHGNFMAYILSEDDKYISLRSFSSKKDKMSQFFDRTFNAILREIEN